MNKKHHEKQESVKLIFPPCARAVFLPGQRNAVSHAVDCLVIIGEEAMNFARSPCAYSVPLPGQCDPVLHTVDSLVMIGEEAMDVPQFIMRMRSSFTWQW